MDGSALMHIQAARSGLSEFKNRAHEVVVNDGREMRGTGGEGRGERGRFGQNTLYSCTRFSNNKIIIMKRLIPGDSRLCPFHS